jgi:hypothetical protein
VQIVGSRESISKAFAAIGKKIELVGSGVVSMRGDGSERWWCNADHRGGGRGGGDLWRIMDAIFAS